MTERLKQIDSHEALFLLRHCFAMPKLTYFLRTAPCFTKTNTLEKFDGIVKEALVDILNISLPQNAYSQATLPIANGGLGLRLATDIALVGFLSSVCATAATAQNLLPPSQANLTNEYWETAFTIWKQQSSQTTKPEIPIYQSNWDKEIIDYRYQELLHSTTSVEKKLVCWLFLLKAPQIGFMPYPSHPWDSN